jgi:hypothetical protein
MADEAVKYKNEDKTRCEKLALGTMAFLITV